MNSIYVYILLILSIAPPLQATTYYVNASQNGSGSSWDDAFAHLQDALSAASSGDQIWVAEGIYYPDLGATQTNDDRTSTFQLKNGVGIYGGFLGLPSETELSARETYGRTTLSGDLLADDDTTGDSSENAYHVVTGSGTDATAILDGFLITAGNANGNSPYDYGGALYNDNGSPTLNNCALDYNYASNQGGAVFSLSSSSPTFNHCQFGFNSVGNFGGAMANISNSSPRLNDCIFGYNRANTAGGALYNYQSSSPTLNKCSFEGNWARLGGGAIVNRSDCVSTLNHCSLLFNEVAYGGGGAIDNIWDSTIQLNNCSLRGNTAQGGGAIRNLESSLSLNNCSLLNNSAVSTSVQSSLHYINGGGAISNLSNANMTLTNCTLWDNASELPGGGIANGGYNGYYDYDDSDFSSLALTNCIIWKNEAAGSLTTTDASVANTRSSTSSYTHSLVANSGGSSNWATALGTDNGNNIDTDPLFIDDSDLRLMANSPALDTGDGTEATSINTTIQDLSNQTRFIGIIDMGAYEGSYTTFANEFSSLNPDEDANENGLSNFLDYALGVDPTAPHDPSTATTLVNGSLTFSNRVYAADVTPVYKKSTDLTQWTTLVEGIDYDTATTISFSQRAYTSILLTPSLLSEPKVFFTQELSID